MHGFGVFKNPYGVFEGDFKFGFLEGKGVATFSNGDKYSGEFNNSQMTGYGCYSYNDGSQIIGLFENGVCNKHGKKIYPDGRIYIGEFTNDIENGKGILINGENKIKGIWRNAMLVEELVSQPLTYEMTMGNYSTSSQKRGHSTSMMKRNRQRNSGGVNDSEDEGKSIERVNEDNMKSYAMME